MTAHPEVDAATVPWVTVAEMAEVDRVMIDELGITLVQMMENAGRGVAVLARHLLGGVAGRRVRVLAGTGGNGGGGPDRLVPDLVWRYPEPRDDGRRLVGRYAIHHERCDTAVDGRHRP